DKQFFSLSYESLVGNPEPVLQNLCQFLEVPYSSAMLDFHQSGEANSTAASSSLWGNVTKPVIASNTKKFMTNATAEEVKIFELVAGDVLDTLGYERVHTAKGEGSNFNSAEIAKFDAENQQLKSQVKEEMDPADLERRKRQAGLLEEIEARQPISVG
ncbi:MAG: hypothetical protein WBA10_13060, partial [Elainellaceae cyanobacterium]